MGAACRTGWSSQTVPLEVGGLCRGIGYAPPLGRDAKASSPTGIDSISITKNMRLLVILFLALAASAHAHDGNEQVVNRFVPQWQAFCALKWI